MRRCERLDNAVIVAAFGSYFDCTIKKGKPLTMNYRLWLQEGLIQRNEVEALSGSNSSNVEGGIAV